MKWLKDLKENKEEKTNILKNKAVLKLTFSNTIFMYLNQKLSKYSAEYFKKKHFKKQSRIQFSLFKIRTV